MVDSLSRDPSLVLSPAKETQETLVCYRGPPLASGVDWSLYADGVQGQDEPRTSPIPIINTYI